MKKRRAFPLVLTAIVVAYFLGPAPDAPDLENLKLGSVPSDLMQIESWIREKNSAFKIKPDNGSYMKWANEDSIYQTEYTLLYLHGFSASPGEGLPMHEDIAKEYGMNLYVPRLFQHGLIEDEPMLGFTGEGWMTSAKEAIEVAKTLGEKVVIMSCSTGGTASLFLSAENDPAIAAQICYSPNVDLYDSKSFLLTKPWGLQIGRKVLGGEYYTWDVPEGAEKYWHGKYRLESLIQLKAMIDESMTKETFEKINVPTFIAYYYKNEEEQDDVVAISATKEMIKELGVAKEDLDVVVLPSVGAHAMQSHFFSKDLEGLKKETREFLDGILK
ncbi:MAG: alpha/beta hydrolase [Flavobacteriales bacterium]|nr:alpha/beta hydrolase [Flavobacteriales bacterium]